MALKIPTQKSFKMKERMHRGAAIANALPQFQSCQQVADQLGISHQAVRKIECLALAKLEEKLREMCAKEGGEI